MAKTGLKPFKVEEMAQELTQIIRKGYPQEARRLLDDMGNSLVRRVKIRTPVKEGDLRTAWTADKTKSKGRELYKEVTNSKKYATWIEYGVRTDPRTDKKIYTKAQYPLTKSLKTLERDMPKLVKRTYDKIMEGLDG